MLCVVEVAITPPRTISAPSDWAGERFLPFVEITARADVEVPEWGVREPVWLHWSAPVLGGSVEVGAARRFDPGRRAAAPGEPDPARRVEGALPPANEVTALAVAVARAWRAELHRHPRLDLVSRLDEPLADFLRRCRAVIGRALRAGAAAHESVAAELDRLPAEVETRALGAEHLRVLSIEARVGWYPEGERPDRAPCSLMLDAAAGVGR
ncbi:MAG: hypothetical protein ACOY3Y_07130 [Acidobacteriota bacterium]